MDDLPTRFCSTCEKDVVVVETVLTSGPHYSKQQCPQCGRFLAFGKKPENEGKRGKNKHTPESLGISHCQMCGREKGRLGSRGVLEAHHIDEIHDGGSDTPENIWVVCTSCHKLIHHQRTYLNQHLSGLYTVEELQVDMDKYRIPSDTQAIMRRLFDKHEALNV